MKKTENPRMAVVRAFPRVSEFLFYTNFEKFKNILIGNSASVYETFKNYRGVDSKLLRLRASRFIDPIKFLTGKSTHRSWSYFCGLEDAVKNADVINISDLFYFYCRQCAQLSKKIDKPLVSVIWETMPNHPARYLMPYSANIRKSVQACSLYILRSERSLAFTDSLKIPRSKVSMIYKGVDTNLFRPAKGTGDNKVRILYVGQFVESKGVDDLLSVFCRLYKKYKNIELVMAGSGELELKINGLAQNHPINNLGYIDYFSLPDVYGNADIFCMPSRDLRYFGFKFGEERFSYTLMEAMSSGIPIVSTKCGGIEEEVGEENFLANQGDSDQIYKYLEELILHEEVRAQIGKKNRKRAMNFFDAGKQARKTEAEILKII